MEVQILSSAQMTFEEQLISEYLKLGSIDSVFKKNNYDLPISFSGFARLLAKNNIVTTAGPNSHLSESLYFFSLLKEYGGSVLRLHKKLGLNVSTQTLHRILHNVRTGITRRYGTALLLEDINSPGKYLLGRDFSLKGKLGKRGDWSLPMGHTREQDSDYTSILRILQREVFTDLTIKRHFPNEILKQNLKSIFSIDITDIKVHVYHLMINSKKRQFSSFKLNNHQFLSYKEIASLQSRTCVKEIIRHYESNSLNENTISDLNRELAFLHVRSKIS